MTVAASGRSEERAQIEARVAAAARAMLEDGVSYTALSVSDLAAEAGLPRTLFYYHFRDKREVLERLLEDVVAEIDVVARQFWAHKPPFTRAALRKDVGQLTAIWRRHGSILGAIAEAAAYDDVIRRGYGAFIDNMIAITAEQLGQSEYRIRFAPGTTHEALATTMIWFCERACLQIGGRAETDDAAFADMTEALTDIAWTVFEVI